MRPNLGPIGPRFGLLSNRANRVLLVDLQLPNRANRVLLVDLQLLRGPTENLQSNKEKDLNV